jgi:hypothetical protein
MDAIILTVGVLLVIALVVGLMTRRRSSPPGAAFEPEAPVAPGTPPSNRHAAGPGAANRGDRP